MTGTRFIADAMLGKLAKWLRLAGLDVIYFNDIDDNILIDKALSEDRVILTRDRNIEKRKVVKQCLMIRSDYLEEQIKQFLEYYKLNSFDMAFSRCIRCNTLLAEGQKNTLSDKGPAYVFKTNEKFKQCTSCNRIYWAGTHRENAERFLRKFVG